MTGNHDDAGDLTQEVFIKAFQSIGSFRGESPLGAWLRKIALNEARGRLRKTGRRDEVLRQGPWTETGSDRTTDTDDSLDVADALGSIEPDAREILLLRYHQDLSHAEIAETMEIPMGTVASRLNRARAAIKKILDERR
jgi:RNA polymerase sigma-70 factor (ECF subfamily)